MYQRYGPITLGKGAMGCVLTSLSLGISRVAPVGYGHSPEPMLGTRTRIRKMVTSDNYK